MQKIGIIGLGFLGSALKRYFEKNRRGPARLSAPQAGGRHLSAQQAGAGEHRLFFYDSGKQIGSPEEVNRADIIFVCVNTPYSVRAKTMDASFLESALRIIRPGKIVVIRSTVIPGTMLRLQKKFPKLKLLLNPEFLREKNADNDFLHPPMQIIGYTKESRPYAKKILKLLPRTPHTAVMPVATAEFIKYFVNAFLAMKVIFANVFWEACKKQGADYNVLQKAVGTEPRVGTSHLDVWYEGFRGYSGTCFPKDTKSLIAIFNKLRVDSSFLEAMDRYNDKLLKKQKIQVRFGYPIKNKISNLKSQK